jgi:hypothetical protein
MKEYLPVCDILICMGVEGGQRGGYPIRRVVAVM